MLLQFFSYSIPVVRIVHFDFVYFQIISISLIQKLKEVHFNKIDHILVCHTFHSNETTIQISAHLMGKCVFLALKV